MMKKFLYGPNHVFFVLFSADTAAHANSQAMLQMALAGREKLCGMAHLIEARFTLLNSPLFLFQCPPTKVPSAITKGLLIRGSGLCLKNILYICKCEMLKEVNHLLFSIEYGTQSTIFHMSFNLIFF